MKKCFECGTELQDNATVCPNCGAPQSTAQTEKQFNYPQATPAVPSSQQIWNSPVFSILSFVSAVLFTLGALVFLITAFLEWEFIFTAVVLFIASILNLVASVPNFIKQLSKNNNPNF